ncbi:hypothetical protein EON79_00890 [bacterium]|nr:MAG: hypothetical protein EON79_00890 [bacterium]
MRLNEDLTSRRAIFAKGWLFLLLGGFSLGGLLLLHPSWEVAGLSLIAIWAFCRWYYFAFYVIEKYVDPSFRFAGLGSFLIYVWRSRTSGRSSRD